jgi:ribose transport system substrate-binding protein
MRSIYRAVIISALVFTLLVQLSCNSPRQGTVKIKRLGFVALAAADFWTIARKGAEKADAELDDVALDFRTPAEATAADQKRIVDDLLAKGLDGLAISPVDPVNQTQMINEIAKKVLVVTQDSDAPQSDRACYVGTTSWRTHQRGAS